MVKTYAHIGTLKINNRSDLQKMYPNIKIENTSLSSDEKIFPLNDSGVTLRKAICLLLPFYLK